MKLRFSFFLAVVFLTVSCQRARLSPVVLQSPSEDKTTKPVEKTPTKTASASGAKTTAKKTTASKASGAGAGAGAGTKTADKGDYRPSVASEKPRTTAVEHSSAKGESKADRVAEAARVAANKKRLAAARRIQARKLAAASLEAGRQLLREEQNTAALRAFREAVRLNSRSPEAWIGIAYVCERNGNTKDAVDAFREAKRLWGM